MVSRYCCPRGCSVCFRPKGRSILPRAIATAVALATAAFPQAPRSREINEEGGWQMVRNGRTGVLRLAYGSRTLPLAQDPREAVQSFIGANSRDLGVRSEDLREEHTLEFPESIYFYYQQLAGGIPVVGAELIVAISRSGEVIFIKSTCVDHAPVTDRKSVV